MNESTAEEREVIHHVDSVFGILLAIAAFQSNLVFSFARELISPYPDIYIIVLAISLIAGIFCWLVAVLKQSWPLRLYAWHATLFLLLWEIVLLVYGTMSKQMGGEEVRVPSGVMMGIIFVSSYLFSRYLVVRAYWNRLQVVAPEGVEIGKLARYRPPVRWTTWAKLAISFAVLLAVSVYLP